LSVQINMSCQNHKIKITININKIPINNTKINNNNLNHNMTNNTKFLTLVTIKLNNHKLELAQEHQLIPSEWLKEFL
jgi:hypothetical protein